MDLKILKSFVSVANHKSFSAAARELHTVQPAISRHIAMLEEELAVTLFTRNSREVAITSAGEQLLKDATQILALTTLAKSHVKQAEQGQIGTLNIAYMSSACLTFMAQLVRDYTTCYPQVHVRLFEMTASEQITAFKQNSIDIGFSRPLPAPLNQSFKSHTIYIDKLVAVVANEHPLAACSSINLAALKGQPFILFNREEAVGLFDSIIAICNSEGFSPHITSQPKHMQTVLTEVSAGLGIALAPHCIKKQFSKGCTFLTLNKVDKDIELHMQHKCANLSATVNAFVNVALKARPQIIKSMA